jgi:hypothetical protein
MFVGKMKKNSQYVWAHNFLITTCSSSYCDIVATLLWEECEDETHTLEMGTWESSETLESLEFDCEGQNSLPWGVLYIIGKLLKCRCPKWACMTHLNICNTSYGQKNGRESNWQFDSRPLKVRRWRAICCWKALDEGYNFF